MCFVPLPGPCPPAGSAPSLLRCARVVQLADFVINTTVGKIIFYGGFVTVYWVLPFLHKRWSAKAKASYAMVTKELDATSEELRTLSQRLASEIRARGGDPAEVEAEFAAVLERIESLKRVACI